MAQRHHDADAEMRLSDDWQVDSGRTAFCRFGVSAKKARHRANTGDVASAGDVPDELAGAQYCNNKQRQHNVAKPAEGKRRLGGCSGRESSSRIETDKGGTSDGSLENVIRQTSALEQFGH